MEHDKIFHFLIRHSSDYQTHQDFYLIVAHIQSPESATLGNTPASVEEERQRMREVKEAIIMVCKLCLRRYSPE